MDPKSKYKKYGFTLIELVVVLGISIFLISSIASLVTSFEVYSRMDNYIRKIKTEILSAKFSAMTSLVSNTNNTNLAVSLGWFVYFENINNNATLFRKAIYAELLNQSNYEIENLTQHINNFREYLNNQNFLCNNNDNFLLNNNQNQNVSFGGLSINLKCGGSDRDSFSTPYTGVNFEQSGCRGVFFQSIYGNAAFSYINPNNNNNCQLKILNKKQSNFLFDYGQAVLIDISGSIRLCGQSCY